MIDRYKYTWKMVKPLIPIAFLAIWAVLFEEKIWPNWEKEKPVKIFKKSELQWEYAMDPEISQKNYRFKFVQFSGNISSHRKDTLVVDDYVFCIMENLKKGEYDKKGGSSIIIKGRILGYNPKTKKLRLDRCFIL